LKVVVTWHTIYKVPTSDSFLPGGPAARTNLVYCCFSGNQRTLDRRKTIY
jgi:hypothetical protein